jgi:hypothetical protein
MGFTSPDEKTIRDAIGDVTQLPVQLQRALASDHDAFEPIPKPGSGDWLAVHQEQDQTFEQFKASSPNRPAPTWKSRLPVRSIVLSFPGKRQKFLAHNLAVLHRVNADF